MESLYIERDELLAEIDSLRKQIIESECANVDFNDLTEKFELSIMRDQLSHLKHELREIKAQIG